MAWTSLWQWETSRAPRGPEMQAAGIATERYFQASGSAPPKTCSRQKMPREQKHCLAKSCFFNGVTVDQLQRMKIFKQAQSYPPTTVLMDIRTTDVGVAIFSLTLMEEKMETLLKCTNTFLPTSSLSISRKGVLFNWDLYI